VLIKDIEFSTYTHKLNAPFKTALRTVDSFEVFQLKLFGEDGNVGVGEVVATPKITNVSVEQILIDIKERIIPAFNQLESKDALRNYLHLERMCPNNPAARALGDLAVVDLFHPQSSGRILSDVTIPIANMEDFPDLIKARVEAGFTTFKLKLDSSELERNIAKVGAVNALLPHGSTLRVDPNQAWSRDYSLRFLEGITSIGVEIEYLEQPVDRFDIEGLAFIKKRCQTSIMADESCFNAEDLKKIVQSEAADWINVKILKTGGFTPARKLAEDVIDAGLKLSIGCMMESPIGVKAAMALAEEFEPNAVHDLDAAWWYLQNQLTYVQGGVE